MLSCYIVREVLCNIKLEAKTILSCILKLSLPPIISQSAIKFKDSVYLSMFSRPRVEIPLQCIQILVECRNDDVKWNADLADPPVGIFRGLCCGLDSRQDSWYRVASPFKSICNFQSKSISEHEHLSFIPQNLDQITKKHRATDCPLIDEMAGNYVAWGRIIMTHKGGGYKTLWLN